MMDGAPILSVIVPLFGAFLMHPVGILARRLNVERVRDLFTVAIMVLVLTIVLSMAPEVWAGRIVVYKLGGWSPPWGIVLAVDGLALQMAMMIGLLGLLVVVYSLTYMERENGLDQFYTLILLVIAGMMGTVLTADIFNFYVFLEIMSVSTYALIAFKREPTALEASMKYLFIGSTGTALILLSIALLYAAVGSLNIADLGRKLAIIKASSTPPPTILVAALGLFLTGIMIKVAMVPFHTWLPDALGAAPTAVSALIAGPAAVVGIYWVARIPYLPFGMPVGIILIALGLLSMVAGVLMALVQTDFKRMLAYHVISQKGYMVLGIGLGTTLGIQGGLFHLLNHSTYKSMLFMAAGAVLYRVGSQKFDELGGLARNMPLTAAVFLIGALAISGIPPLNGFVSKYIIYLAGVDAGQPWITAIAVLVSGLTLASFFKAFSSVFLGPPQERFKDVKEAPKPMLIPMVIMAAICIAIGLMPALGFNVAGPAEEAAVNAQNYIDQVLGGT
ncbi:MAG: hypothetical protein APU95_04395 [Hadesarchaea archaeon YNP_N21]|jgi:multicomponent Na+:H+ antiporter subunit D|nr:MAG: hypothetical protein APU95_04395 [Hadesarchaea archaeon YNP_N21]